MTVLESSPNTDRNCSLFRRKIRGGKKGENDAETVTYFNKDQTSDCRLPDELIS